MLQFYEFFRLKGLENLFALSFLKDSSLLKKRKIHLYSFLVGKTSYILSRLFLS